MDHKIHFQGPLLGSPFCGLIVQTTFGLCAYVGVPLDHWMADFDALDFPCHRDITFRGPGGDGIRPAGFYWYGWDYQHYGDSVDLPEDVRDLMSEELVQFFSSGKRWTVEEIKLDMIDAAIFLQAALDQAEQLAKQVGAKPLPVQR